MANPIPIYRYPLDGTGQSPDNLVVGEEHQLSNRAVRCVAPTYGGFFADSVVVKDLATNLPLIRGVDYNFGELFEFPTGRYGKEIFGIIAITKPGVAKVAIDYQALGGDYSYSMDSIIAMIDSLDLGERPVAWGSIIDRPTRFDPASHFHDIGDVYGFEYVVHAIDLVRQAILMGDVVSHDEIYRYIDRTANGQQDKIQEVRAALDAHIADKNNPHNTTKAQIGLGLVENYPIATPAQMEAGTSNQLYVTPALTSKYVQDHAKVPLNNHIADKNNPHNTTKAQVGLSLVENYSPATDAIAITATSTDHYMTPATTKALVQNWAINPLEVHIANKNNPHATTKAQVGLGLVENFSPATDAIATAGLSTSNYMTPATTRAAVRQWAMIPLETHIADKGNPHSVTKAQVGLGNVLNYGVASQAEMDAGASNGVYLTPMTVAKYVTDRAVTPLNSHIANKNNPHSTTKAQVGLGSVENYPPADNATALAGTSSSHYLTPANLNHVVTTKAVTPLNNHIGDKNNPHNVTKSQVGLGNVNNYGTATVAETQAGTSTTLHVTPKGVNDAFNSWAGRIDTSDGRLNITSTTASVFVGGQWRQFWPPLWQG